MTNQLNLGPFQVSSVPLESLKDLVGTSLVAQWLRIRLPMPGTRV